MPGICASGNINHGPRRVRAETQPWAISTRMARVTCGWLHLVQSCSSWLLMCRRVSLSASATEAGAPLSDWITVIGFSWAMAVL